MTAKSHSRKTTPSRPREETVAEPGEVEGESTEQASAASSTPVVEPPLASVAEPADPVDPVAAKGYCDNHPDRPAVFVTDFPWSQPQRFCARCVPEQYKPLMK